MDKKYYPTIGLEIHAELKTKTKMFCSCLNNPDEENPNTNICPVCMAHPGTLPVANKKAIENVIKVGLAIDGIIADFTEFDRKNYFYPDIPKGYQISQYKYPIVSGGKLAGFDITRIHLEEDTGEIDKQIRLELFRSFKKKYPEGCLAYRFEAPHKNSKHDYWHLQYMNHKEHCVAGWIPDDFPCCPIWATNLPQLMGCVIASLYGKIIYKELVDGLNIGSHNKLSILSK